MWFRLVEEFVYLICSVKLEFLKVSIEVGHCIFQMIADVGLVLKTVFFEFLVKAEIFHH